MGLCVQARASYDQLREIAGVFAQQAEASQQTLRSIQSAKDVLEGGEWVGESADKFYAEMNSAVLPSLKRLVVTLNHAAQSTQKISQAMKRAEEDAARALGSYGSPGSPQGSSAGSASGSGEPSRSSSGSGEPSSSSGDGPSGGPADGGGQPPPTPAPETRPDVNQAFQDFKNNRQPYAAQYVGYPRNEPERTIAQLAGVYRRDITDREADLLDEIGYSGVWTMDSVHDEAFAKDWRPQKLFSPSAVMTRSMDVYACLACLVVSAL